MAQPAVKGQPLPNISAASLERFGSVVVKFTLRNLTSAHEMWAFQEETQDNATMPGVRQFLRYSEISVLMSFPW